MRVKVESLFGAIGAVRALFFLNGFLFGTWATRIPAFRDQYQLDNGQLGFALVGIALGAVISMPLAGWLCDRFGSRPVCLLGATFYLLSLIFVAHAPSVFLLGMTLIFFGMGHGLLDVGMNLQVVEIERRLSRTVMSTFHALWSVGGLVGAISGVLITATGLGMGRHFFLVAMISAIALSYSYRFLLTRPGSHPDEPEAPSSGSSFRLTKATLVLGIVAFCVMLGEGAMADWSAVFLHDVLGADEMLSAAGYAVFALAMATGRFCGDALTLRYGSTNQVRYSGLLALVGFLLIATSHHAYLAFLGCALVGAGLSTIVPVVFSVAGKLDGISPGIAIGSVSTLGYFGFLIGPPSIGLLAEWFDLRLALSSLVLLMMLVVVATRRMPE